MRLRSVTVGVAATAALLTGPVTGPAHAGSVSKQVAQATALPVNTADFKGVNWADVQDNYRSSALVLTGMTATDDYATVKAKAGPILDGFKALGANTVRLPINTYTVGTSAWTPYRGAIDAATARGMKVILTYWEEEGPDKPGAHKGVITPDPGTTDGTTRFDAMWDQVIADYGGQPLVYFEPMNEPYGYADGASAAYGQQPSSPQRWIDVADNWLNNMHTDVPRDRVLIDGVGYGQHVAPIGDAPQFDGTLLSLHVYDFFGDWDAAAVKPMAGCYAGKPTSAIPSPNDGTNEYDHCTHAIGEAIGSAANEKRTVITEFGTWTLNGTFPTGNGTGRDYNHPLGDPASNPVGDPHSPDEKIDYLRAVTNFAHDKQLGAVYWPGLSKTGGNTDGYSLTHLNTAGGTTSLAVNNPTLLDRLHYAWNPSTTQFCAPGPIPGGRYFLRNSASGDVLDVPGGNTANGTRLEQWPFNGGANQQWTLTDLGCGLYTIMNVATGKSIDVNGQSLYDGGVVDQWDYTGGANEQFLLTPAATGSTAYRIDNLNSLKALDDPGYSNTAGTDIDQWWYLGGSNQQWTFVPAGS